MPATLTHDVEAEPVVRPGERHRAGEVVGALQGRPDIDALRARIEDVDPKIDAYLSIDFDAATKEAEKILTAVQLKAEAGGVDCNTLHTIANAPWEAILAAAKKAKCDAIVMASHGRRGVSALLLGSETQKVLTHSKLPVIIVR